MRFINPETLNVSQYSILFYISLSRLSSRIFFLLLSANRKKLLLKLFLIFYIFKRFACGCFGVKVSSLQVESFFFIYILTLHFLGEFLIIQHGQIEEVCLYEQAQRKRYCRMICEEGRPRITPVD